MEYENVYKMQSALQIATNALNEIKKNSSSSVDYKIAENALEYIKEKTSMIPNNAKVPQSQIMYAGDYTEQGMGYA